MHHPVHAQVSPLDKGLGHLEGSVAPGHIASLGWNLLREDISLPAAVLYQDRVMHNLQWMQQFIEEYGLKLAPHGKTTMTPRLFDLQLQGGAWGITLATAHHARSLRAWRTACAHGESAGRQREHGHRYAFVG
jgi:D-serine dehydratase